MEMKKKKKKKKKILQQQLSVNSLPLPVPIGYGRWRIRVAGEPTRFLWPLSLAEQLTTTFTSIRLVIVARNVHVPAKSYVRP